MDKKYRWEHIVHLSEDAEPGSRTVYIKDLGKKWCSSVVIVPISGSLSWSAEGTMVDYGCYNSIYTDITNEFEFLAAGIFQQYGYFRLSDAGLLSNHVKVNVDTRGGGKVRVVSCGWVRSEDKPEDIPKDERIGRRPSGGLKYL